MASAIDMLRMRRKKGIVLKGALTGSVPFTGGSGTLDISSLGCQAGDYLIVLTATSQSTSNLGAPTVTGNVSGSLGAALADLYANDTDDTNAFAFGMVLTGADTQITVDSGGGAGHAALVICYSGVNSTTPLDVATTTATGINGDLADPAAITPVTGGAKIVALYAAAQQSGTAWTAPANVNNFTQFGVNLSGLVRVGGGDADWTSGAFNPAAVTGGNASTSNSWAAVTLALRPA